MSMDESEIMDFARKYDPQPIHTDREAAAEGPFEGLIASGWHTGSMVFRLWVDLGFMEKSSLGGPGIENLRWLVPVRPGDTLHPEVEIIEARPPGRARRRGRPARRVRPRRERAGRGRVLVRHAHRAELTLQLARAHARRALGGGDHFTAAQRRGVRRDEALNILHVPIQGSVV